MVGLEKLYENNEGELITHEEQDVVIGIHLQTKRDMLKKKYVNSHPASDFGRSCNLH